MERVTHHLYVLRVSQAYIRPATVTKPNPTRYSLSKQLCFPYSINFRHLKLRPLAHFCNLYNTLLQQFSDLVTH